MPTSPPQTGGREGGREGVLEGVFEGDICGLHSEVLAEVGVHSGFYARFLETGCIEEVKKIVTDSPGRQVCFTGHSLGAAVAAIFALHVLAGLGGQDRRRVRCSTLPSALSLVPS
jgi:hypothetical protein